VQLQLRNDASANLNNEAHALKEYLCKTLDVKLQYEQVLALLMNDRKMAESILAIIQNTDIYV
jgi:hypothetical protein